MSKYFKGRYRIKSNRKSDWDYGSNGKYFITICTDPKKPYFGQIDDGGILDKTAIALYTEECWKLIPSRYPFIILDSFVIMPDHIHGILIINKKNKRDNCTNAFGSQSNNLGAVIRGFKGAVTRYANSENIEFSWQKSYHDHIIQNEIAYNKIRKYITENPIRYIHNKKSKSP